MVSHRIKLLLASLFIPIVAFAQSPQQDIWNGRLMNNLNANGKQITGLDTSNLGFASTSTTINGHPLSANVTLTPSDLGLSIGSNVEAWSANLDSWSTHPTTDFVPSSRTVNGHALSSNFSLSLTDLGIPNVTNDAQAKASIYPNGTPTNGQLPIGNGTGFSIASLTPGTNVTITPGAGTLTISATAGAGGYATIQNQGSNVTTRTTFNFIGSSVVAADNSGASRTDITITDHGITALTGDVTASGDGSQSAALANIPSGVTMAGNILASNISAPATPAANKNRFYFDSGSKNMAAKNDAGVVNHGIQTQAGSSHNWIKDINDDGSTDISQPAMSDITGAPSGAVVGTTDAQTLSGKRITARVTTIASSATPAVNTDVTDCVTITAQADDITSMTSSLTGTPNNFDQLEYRIKDNGSARAIAWGTSFASGTGTLPTTTIPGKVLHVYFEEDTVQSKWICASTGSDP